MGLTIREKIFNFTCIVTCAAFWIFYTFLRIVWTNCELFESFLRSIACLIDIKLQDRETNSIPRSRDQHTCYFDRSDLHNFRKLNSHLASVQTEITRIFGNAVSMKFQDEFQVRGQKIVGGSTRADLANPWQDEFPRISLSQ